MDPPPPPQPVATASPPGLGVVVAGSATEMHPPASVPQFHYQYNVSHRWPDFANFMNYPPPPNHPPHPGFATFSGSPGGGGGVVMGSAEAYHSYQYHQLSAHHQVINGISMRLAGDYRGGSSSDVVRQWSETGQWRVCCGWDLSGRIKGSLAESQGMMLRQG